MSLLSRSQSSPSSCLRFLSSNWSMRLGYALHCSFDSHSLTGDDCKWSHDLSGVSPVTSQSSSMADTQRTLASPTRRGVNISPFPSRRASTSSLSSNHWSNESSESLDGWSDYPRQSPTLGQRGTAQGWDTGLGAHPPLQSQVPLSKSPVGVRMLDNWDDTPFDSSTSSSSGPFPFRPASTGSNGSRGSTSTLSGSSGGWGSKTHTMPEAHWGTDPSTSTAVAGRYTLSS